MNLSKLRQAINRKRPVKTPKEILDDLQEKQYEFAKAEFSFHVQQKTKYRLLADRQEYLLDIVENEAKRFTSWIELKTMESNAKVEKAKIELKGIVEKIEIAKTLSEISDNME